MIFNRKHKKGTMKATGIVCPGFLAMKKLHESHTAKKAAQQ